MQKLFTKEFRPGEKWSGLIGKNKYIHFKALGDNANVSILLYNMRDTSERYMHHVLDDTFREDRSSARKSRNNLALIRKFAFDILKIACIHDDAGKGIQKMSDWFADDINLIAKYVFHGIQRIR